MDARNEGHVLSFVDLFNCSTTNTIEYVYTVDALVIIFLQL